LASKPYIPRFTKDTGLRVSAIDLFCGAGGLTHGFIKEGVAVNAGIDLDPACKYPYEHNNGAAFILKDIREVTGSEIGDLYPDGDIKILAGCAPCQPFSNYTNGQETRQDEKWGLLYEFSRLVSELLPEVVTMENVLQLAKHDVFPDFRTSLKALGYHVTVNEVECSQYGVPQSRKRLVLFGSLFGEIELIPPTHRSPRTVRDTIEKLPAILAGEVCPRDSLHRSSGLSERNMQRIRASRPGGTWRDWDESLVARCHKKRSGKTYPAVYGRMEWDEPSPTITTQFFGFGSGRFGHPQQDRALSLREGAMLQTFPKYYAFVDGDNSVMTSNVGRLIGNAVPVRLGQVVARSIVRHLRNKMDGAGR